MKQIFGISITLALFSFSNLVLYSQACTPDPGFTGEGISPDTTTNMAPACVGIAYSETFTVHPPPDTVISGFLFTINFMRIDSVVGLPAGFSYTCSPANCTYPGGTIGCAIVTGNPTFPQIGFYPLTIYGTTQVYNPIFGTIDQPVSFDGYRLKIGGGMNITTGSIDAGCGVSDGSVWAAVTGGALPLSYVWNTSPVSNNDTVINLPAGPYQINVTDNYGCMDSANVNINNPNSPIIDSIAGINNICFGDSLGTATSFVSMGTIPYTYSWSNGDTSATINNLPEGTYSLIVTDSNNCISLMENVSIGAPSAINGLLSSTSESCIGCNDGSSSVLASGGTSPYLYLWSNSGTDDTINGVATGMYVVTITDSLGCSFTDSVMVNSTAGINENYSQHSFVVYPNPAKDFINIESTNGNGEMVKIEITDLHGRVIANFEMSNKIYSIDIHAWPEGIYLIRIYKREGFEVYKLIRVEF